MNKEELDRVGCNICPEHMDFTIGTKDLVIVAKTYKNEVKYERRKEDSLQNLFRRA